MLCGACCYRTMLVALQFESGLIFLCSNHISFVNLRQVYVCSLSVCYVPVLFPPVFSTRTRPRALGGFPAVSSVFSFVGAFHHRAGGFWCTLSFDFCTIPPFRVRSALARLACQTMFAQPLGSGPNRKVAIAIGTDTRRQQQHQLRRRAGQRLQGTQQQ